MIHIKKLRIIFFMIYKGLIFIRNVIGVYLILDNPLYSQIQQNCTIVSKEIVIF